MKIIFCPPLFTIKIHSLSRRLQRLSLCLLHTQVQQLSHRYLTFVHQLFQLWVQNGTGRSHLWLLCLSLEDAEQWPQGGGSRRWRGGGQPGSPSRLGRLILFVLDSGDIDLHKKFTFLFLVISRQKSKLAFGNI